MVLALDLGAAVSQLVSATNPVYYMVCGLYINRVWIVYNMVCGFSTNN